MLIGRQPEIEVLHTALRSDTAEMIAVIGRRRVGKTFLIDQIYGDHIVFQQTGVRYAPPDRQLRTFANKLSLLTGSNPIELKDWLDAFFQLRLAIEALPKTNKKAVIFFDELSWLATPEGEFIDYLAHFWNDWAHRQKLVIVLCGSVSSWIINKVINDKGGLHNRVTRYIHLKPFDCTETAQFLESRNINFSTRQIFQLYMTTGGIPLYLEDLKPGYSLTENIDELCFTQTGLLHEEFNRLYPALFEDAHFHVETIRTLATAPRGLSRKQIIKQSSLPNGGTTSRILDELQQSDFIESVPAFGNKKTKQIYRLIDEYSLFYLRFIENNKLSGPGTWLQLSQGQSYNIWSGYAFESLCFKHILQIKKALGISGVSTSISSFSHAGDETNPGLQIDMLIERADQAIHLCEIKFYRAEYRLNKKRIDEIQEKTDRFISLTKTSYQVIPTLIVGGAFRENELSSSSGIRIIDAEAFLK
ncbi:MAG: ATP-binding protein [Bacteroidota bacterium]